MTKIKIENNVSSICVESKQNDSDTWVSLFCEFICALKGMGYHVGVLDAVKEAVVTYDDENLFKGEEFIEYLKDFNNV